MGYGRTRNWTAVVLAVLVLLLLPQAHTAAASSGLNLTTSPLPIRLSTTPGATVATILRVKSNATTTEQLRVGLMKFDAAGQTGQPNLFDRGPHDSYFDWVTFTPSTFDALPSQWIDIKMTINVPKDAGLGYYYAVTFQRASDQPQTSNGKPQASIVGATATLVLLDVRTPGEHRSMQLNEFYADHKFYQYLPATFGVRVRNTGNIFISARGNIFIKKGNKTLATLDVNAAGGSVLPKSQRLFTTEWKDGFPLYTDRDVSGKPIITKSGKPARRLEWDLSRASKLRFGKYTAQVLMVYNDGKHDVPMQATLSFWVIPWGLIAAIILIPLLPAVLVYIIMHRSHKKASWKAH